MGSEVEARALRFVRAAGILALTIATPFLAAWISGEVKAIAFASPRMKANTSFGLVLLAVALLTTSDDKRPVNRALRNVCACLAAAVGLATLGEYVFDRPFGIDELLARDLRGAMIPFPNRTPPHSALSLALTAAAVMAASSRQRFVAGAMQAIALLVLLMNLLALLGYLYGVGVFYRPHALTRVSPFTAFAITALGAGTIAARPNLALARRFFGNGTGARWVRRLIPVTLLLPAGVGWITLRAEQRGMVPDDVQTAILVLALMLILSSVVVFLGRSLDKLDERRATIEGDLRRLVDLTAASASALAGTTERLRVALEAATIGTYSWDVQTGAFEHDASVRAIVGIDPYEKITVENFAHRVHHEDRATWLATLERSRVRGTDFELRYRVTLPEGGMRWVLDKARVLKDERGKPVQLVGAVVDLTSEHEARESAEAANRAKDEFLAMLGHELRNPLSPILTSLELMKLRGGDEFKRERDIIERQAQHMVRLVDDLLDVSRITRGKVELRKERVSAAELVAGAVETVAPLIEKRSHNLETLVSGDDLWVEGDAERLKQVLCNLLVNACRYTPTGGRIRITARRADKDVEVRVRDSGAGISAELMPRLFGMFVQGKQNIERSEGGLGLGLAIVRSLVDLHGGNIRVESPGSGHGSEFIIRLPAAEPRKVDEPVPGTQSGFRSRPSFDRSIRILVVDDNHDAAELLCEALEQAGHEIRIAHDGASALTIARAFRPAIVFLDIGLPVIDGYEVARRLRAEQDGPGPLLVAMTGYGQPSDRERAKAAGFDRHLVKPVELEVTLAIAAEVAMEKHASVIPA